MTKTPMLLAGIFGTFALSWLALTAVPQRQLAELAPQVDEEAGDVYPVNTGGYAARGREVYVANGCVYCHTQQVRDEQNGADLERNWGVRRTVPRDYLYENPVLGTVRNGPDLANVGARIQDAQWHYLHLYNPRTVVKESVMPSFRFLFEKRKISGERSTDALNLVGENDPGHGYEIVPKPDTKALVDYLLSLDRSHDLKEAPVKKEAVAK